MSTVFVKVINVSNQLREQKTVLQWVTHEYTQWAAVITQRSLRSAPPHAILLLKKDSLIIATCQG